MSTQNSNRTSRDSGLYRFTGRLIVLLVGAILCLNQCACLGGRLGTVPNRPVTRTFDTRLEVLRKAVASVLAKEHFILDPEKTTAFHLQTDWLQDGRYRSMAKADLQELGRNQSKLTLELIVQKKALWGESWQEVDDIGRWAYEDLMEAVVMEVYRVLYDAV
ncbi:MAG: hypothetical protein ACLFVT_09215 [Syntrophobacteria bacterium]